MGRHPAILWLSPSRHLHQRPQRLHPRDRSPRRVLERPTPKRRCGMLARQAPRREPHRLLGSRLWGHRLPHRLVPVPMGCLRVPTDLPDLRGPGSRAHRLPHGQPWRPDPGRGVEQRGAPTGQGALVALPRRVWPRDAGLHLCGVRLEGYRARLSTGGQHGQGQVRWWDPGP